MKRLILFFITALLFSAQHCFAVGALYIRELRSTQTFTMMSMKTYDANTVIDNQVATTTVDQVFHNDATQYSQIEATYVFPLPQGAVITQLVYWFNGNKYVANIRERQEAQAAYDATIRRSLDPALLQYFGENTFKLSIAPINYNTDVRFSISYTELLPYNFNKMRYDFLLSTTGLSTKPLDRVSLSITLKTSTDLTRVESPTHGNNALNQIIKISDREYTIRFGDEHYSPDKNYRLEYEYKRDSMNVNVLCYVPTAADSVGEDGFFATWVVPSDNINKSTLPRSVVVCADISSSMEGKRIEQLRVGLNAFVDNLHPQDHFNILLFSTNVIRFQPDLVPATSDNVALALDYIRKNVNAAGLTNISDALNACYQNTFRDSTVKIIAFMTDGMPSWGELDSNKIINSVAAHKSQDIRLFSYGIGEEPSRYLLTKIAGASGGYATFISNDDSISVVIANNFERLSKAVLTNIDLNYGGLDYYDLFPRKLPDLFFGAQVLQLGRYRHGGTYPLTLSGNASDKAFSLSKPETYASITGGNRSVSRLWASSKIDYLLAQIDSLGERKELVTAIIDLSLRFQILTRYTALYSDPNKDKASSVSELERSIDTWSVYPNPASDIVHLQLHFAPDFTAQRVRIDIYTAMGEFVQTIANEVHTAGDQYFSWNTCTVNGQAVGSGMYYARISIGAACMTLPISIVR